MCSAACIYSRLPERSSVQDFMLWKRLEDHDGFRCQCKVTATDLNYSLHNPIQFRKNWGFLGCLLLLLTVKKKQSFTALKFTAVRLLKVKILWKNQTR